MGKIAGIGGVPLTMELDEAAIACFCEISRHIGGSLERQREAEGEEGSEVSILTVPGAADGQQRALQQADQSQAFPILLLRTVAIGLNLRR